MTHTRYIVLLITILTLWSCKKKDQDENYSLTVKIDNLDNPNAKMYLANSFFNFKEGLIDSTSLNNGEFVIEGKISKPKEIAVFIDELGQGLKDKKGIIGVFSMYLEEADIIVTADKDSISNTVITGSKLNTEHKKYIGATKIPSKFNKRSILLRRSIKNEESPEEKERLVTELQDLTNQRSRYKDSVLQTYIKKNPDSYFSLDALIQLDRRNFDQNKLASFYEDLSNQLQSSEDGLEVIEKIKKKRAELGVLAPDFSQNDENGNPVKLSDYRGEYVLLDFWASWCAPCRAENPNLVKAYEKYNNKGFNILAVSLDTKKEAWLKAIEEENLPWTHTSELKGFKDEIATLYDVQAIPKNYLIDPSGKIIATNLRGYRLEEELEKIFD